MRASIGLGARRGKETWRSDETLKGAGCRVLTAMDDPVAVRRHWADAFHEVFQRRAKRSVASLSALGERVEVRGLQAAKLWQPQIPHPHLSQRRGQRPSEVLRVWPR